MSKIFNTEQLADRADDLSLHNGMERAFVTLDEIDSPPAFAWLPPVRRSPMHPETLF